MWNQYTQLICSAALGRICAIYSNVKGGVVVAHQQCDSVTSVSPAAGPSISRKNQMFEIVFHVP